LFVAAKATLAHRPNDNPKIVLFGSAPTQKWLGGIYMPELVTMPPIFQKVTLKVAAPMMSTIMEMDLQIREQQVALFN
jgi:hypothetical protein